MTHIQIGAALDKLRGALATASGDAEADASLTGASFLELEPDLQKEAGANNRRASAFAAGGHPFSD